MANYDTLTEAINDLTKRGYTYNFNVQKNCLICSENNHQLSPEEFTIDEKYRFEEMSDLDSESILYAISSKKEI